MVLTMWFKAKVCHGGSGEGLSCLTLILLYGFYFINWETQLLKSALAASTVNMDIDPKTRIHFSQATKISCDSMKIFFSGAMEVLLPTS